MFSDVHVHEIINLSSINLLRIAPPPPHENIFWNNNFVRFQADGQHDKSMQEM